MFPLKVSKSVSAKNGMEEQSISVNCLRHSHISSELVILMGGCPLKTKADSQKLNQE